MSADFTPKLNTELKPKYHFEHKWISCMPFVYTDSEAFVNLLDEFKAYVNEIIKGIDDSVKLERDNAHDIEVLKKAVQNINKTIDEIKINITRQDTKISDVTTSVDNLTTALNSFESSVNTWQSAMTDTLNNYVTKTELGNYYTSEQINAQFENIRDEQNPTDIVITNGMYVCQFFAANECRMGVPFNTFSIPTEASIEGRFTIHSNGGVQTLSGIYHAETADICDGIVTFRIDGLSALSGSFATRMSGAVLFNGTLHLRYE